jgi:hypothetical protein
MVAMFVNGSGQNEHSLERTFHRCFLPSFTSFDWGVSEEKIKMWKVNGRQTTDAKWWQKLTLPLAKWAKKEITSKFIRVCITCRLRWTYWVRNYTAAGDRRLHDDCRRLSSVNIVAKVVVCRNIFVSWFNYKYTNYDLYNIWIKHLQQWRWKYEQK